MSVDSNETTTKKLGGVTGKGFKPGQSGNPNGRPLKPDILKKHGEKSIKAIIGIAEDNNINANLRYEANKWIVEMCYGKATQSVDADVSAVIVDNTISVEDRLRLLDELRHGDS